MPDLTDDALATQLSHALREGTSDLSYRGAVPTPRSSAWLAAPSAGIVAAAVGAIAVVPTVTGHHAPAPAPSAISSSSTTASVTARGGDVHYSLAAFNGFSVRHGSMPRISIDGSKAPEGTARIEFVANQDAAPPPADARQIELTGPGAAFVGIDPDNGQATLWVKLPGRRGGIVSLTSPQATEQLLLQMLVDTSPNTPYAEDTGESFAPHPARK